MRSLPRRGFLKWVAASCATAGSRIVHASPNEQLRIACIGVGGQGWYDMLQVAEGHRIVAVCDVDGRNLSRAGERFPEARRYSDWRQLLDQQGIDAVTVSTPDHMHAPITMAALLSGRHVYTQKPLTHSVGEARQLTRVARERGLVTQMGIQHHASRHHAAAVRLLRTGTIGTVREVHTWTDRPGNFWPQGQSRPDRVDPVPEELDWDLWLGVAPVRPYVERAYHPFVWRGWWDFGTGALGDMGCHLLDPVVDALKLGPPQTIRAEGPEPDTESGPVWCKVRYQFAGTENTVDPLPLTWYEAGQQPPVELFRAPAEWKVPANGILFIGERGNAFLDFISSPQLFPEGDFSEVQIDDLPQGNHYHDWTSAIVEGRLPACPFDYSGPLTDTVLLGNLAYRSGAAVTWDSAALRVTSDPAANRFLFREYRPSWEVPELGRTLNW